MALRAVQKHGAAWLDNEQDTIELDRRHPGTWTAPADRAAKAEAETTTLADYAGRWLEHRSISRRTRETYTYHLRRNILPVLGRMALTAITPDDVRAWFSGLGTDYESRNARAYGVLTAVLNTAVDDGLIDRSPARIKGGTKVKRTRRSVVLLTAAELAALAEAMPPELRLSVLLAGWCGLRRGEVFALTRGDIAADGSTVRVDKAVVYREHEYTCGPPKTAESNRIVTVPTHLRPALQTHLAVHVKQAASTLLFKDPVTGGFYTEGRYRTPFVTAREAIGKPDLHFHDLRHFGGVMAAVAGGTTREVMDRLGHTTPTAAMRYQHVAAGRADTLAERMSNLA